MQNSTGLCWSTMSVSAISLPPTYRSTDGSSVQPETLYQNKFWAEYLLRNHCSFWGGPFDLLALYQQLCPTPLQHHKSANEMIDELSNRMTSGEFQVYKAHNFLPPPPDRTGADVAMAGKSKKAPGDAPTSRFKSLTQGGKTNKEVQKLQVFDLSCTLPDGTAATGLPYKVTLLSSGASFEGKLDSTGTQHYDNLEPGDVEVTFGKPISESAIEATRTQISRVLDIIIAEQNAQAAELEAGYRQLNPLEKGRQLTAELGKGLFDAGAGLLEFVDDVHNATCAAGYLQRAAAAAWQAYNTTTDDWLTTFSANFNDKNHHALVKALGFDPASISKETLAEAYEIASFVKNDSATQSTLLNFARDFAKAQHELEWAYIGGGALFEIVLTALLAAATGGLGAAGAVAGKARHSGKFAELGRLLKTRTKQLKQKAQYKVKRGQTNGAVAHQIARPDGAEVPTKISQDKPNNLKYRKPPKSLEEVLERLQEAKEKLKKNNGIYQPKYSDDELRAMAAIGDVPDDRFLIRFSVAPNSDSDAIGYVRNSGRHPLWMSTFDQAENADTDAKTLAALFGTNYDPKNKYVMYVIDRGEDFNIDGSDIFVY